MIERCDVTALRSQSQGGRGSTFKVESNSKNYKVPAAVSFPLGEPDAPQGRSLTSSHGRGKGKNEPELFDIPIQFRAKEPGHYPCMVGSSLNVSKCMYSTSFYGYIGPYVCAYLIIELRV